MKKNKTFYAKYVYRRGPDQSQIWICAQLQEIFLKDNQIHLPRVCDNRCLTKLTLVHTINAISYDPNIQYSQIQLPEGHESKRKSKRR